MSEPENRSKRAGLADLGLGLMAIAAGAVLMAVIIAHANGIYVSLPLAAVIDAFACREAARRAGARPG